MIVSTTKVACPASVPARKHFWQRPSKKTEDLSPLPHSPPLNQLVNDLVKIIYSDIPIQTSSLISLSAKNNVREMQVTALRRVAAFEKKTYLGWEASRLLKEVEKNRLKPGEAFSQFARIYRSFSGAMLSVYPKDWLLQCKKLNDTVLSLEKISDSFYQGIQNRTIHLVCKKKSSHRSFVSPQIVQKNLIPVGSEIISRQQWLAWFCSKEARKTLFGAIFKITDWKLPTLPQDILENEAIQTVCFVKPFATEALLRPGQGRSIKKLIFKQARFEQLPGYLFEMQSLQELVFKQCIFLNYIPSELCKLPNLRKVKFKEVEIQVKNLVYISHPGRLYHIKMEKRLGFWHYQAHASDGYRLPKEYFFRQADVLSAS